MTASAKQIKIGIVAGVLLLLTAVLFPQLAETNEAGNYQVKQAAVSGTITVRNEAGMYAQA